MKTGVVWVIMSMLVVFTIALTGCSQKQYTCDVCGKTFTGTAYTDGDWERVMCAECATAYFPSENHKITKEIEEHMKAKGVGAKQGTIPSITNLFVGGKDDGGRLIGVTDESEG